MLFLRGLVLRFIPNVILEKTSPDVNVFGALEFMSIGVCCLYRNLIAAICVRQVLQTTKNLEAGIYNMPSWIF